MLNVILPNNQACKTMEKGSVVDGLYLQLVQQDLHCIMCSYNKFKWTDTCSTRARAVFRLECFFYSFETTSVKISRTLKTQGVAEIHLNFKSIALTVGTRHALFVPLYKKIFIPNSALNAPHRYCLTNQSILVEDERVDDPLLRFIIVFSVVR